jgi:hypothetical protein
MAAATAIALVEMLYSDSCSDLLRLGLRYPERAQQDRAPPHWLIVDWLAVSNLVYTVREPRSDRSGSRRS